MVWKTKPHCSAVCRQSSRSGQTMRCMSQPPLEKPWPKEPKPPRVTPPEPESDDAPDDEWVAESLLKKLDRDDHREPPLAPDELPLPLHAVLVCAGAVPGGGGSQFCRGISVKALVPTAIVPITSSATWLERFTG